jgi:Protein of unknown function (DUF3179)
VVCNSGTGLVPVVDGQLHHFNYVGIYEGLAVIQDRESKTLWNHVTGEAMYGPLVGRTLKQSSNLLQMNVRQALAVDPNMPIAISDREYFVGGQRFGTAPGFLGGRGAERWAPGNPNAQIVPSFVPTLGREDARRPRMDIGLGVWTGSTRRYYPMELLRQFGPFIDQVDGRSLLVYIEPETATPAAMFVRSKAATMDGRDVRLDNGNIVRMGVLLDRQGKRQSAERPQQLFTRWYGFSLTFPGCEVAGN